MRQAVAKKLLSLFRLVRKRDFDMKSLKVAQTVLEKRLEGRNEKRLAKASGTRQKDLGVDSAAQTTNQIALVDIDHSRLPQQGNIGARKRKRLKFEVLHGDLKPKTRSDQSILTAVDG